MVLIDIEKAGQAVLDFIGSDQYKKIVDCQGSSVEGAFISGLSMAYCIMNTTCDKYVADDKKSKNDQMSGLSALTSMFEMLKAKEMENAEEGGIECEGAVQEVKEE